MSNNKVVQQKVYPRGAGFLAAAGLMFVLAGCARSPELDFVNGYDAFQAQKYDEALTYLDRYLEREPYGEHASQVLFLKATIHGRLGDKDQALIALNRLTANFPRSSAFSNALVLEAQIHLSKGDREKAIQTYDRLRRTATDERMAGESINRIVQLYVQDKEYDKAVAYVRDATMPGYRQVKRMMDIAEIWKNAEQYDKALAVCDEVIAATWATPEDRSVGWVAKAAIYAENLKDVTRAVEILHTFREQYPKVPLANWSRVEEARFLRARSQEEADDMARQAIAAYVAEVSAATNPRDRAWYESRVAEAYERWGSLENARNVYVRIAASYSGYPDIWQEADYNATRISRKLEEQARHAKESEDESQPGDEPAGATDASAVGSVSPR